MPSRVFILAALVAVATAQECDYTTNSHCIKAQVSATVPLPFPTLFPTPPTFVYAIDDLDGADLQSVRSSGQLPAAGPGLRVAWWLQFDNKTANRDLGQERSYYAFSMETNAVNPIGGGDGGCADLLGTDCVRNLKDALAWRGLSSIGTNAGFEEELLRLISAGGRPLTNLSCPADIWGNSTAFQTPLRPGSFEQIAVYSKSNLQDVKQLKGPGGPTGNFTHAVPQLRTRSIEEQSNRAVIAVSIGAPVEFVTFDKPAKSTLKDITVDLACLRIGSSSPSTQPAGGPSKNDGVGSMAAGSSAIWAAAAFAGALFL